MAIATYNDLLTEVQDYLFGRPDVVAKVPTFIRLFEGKANRKLFCRQMEKRATASTDINSQTPEFLSLPADYQTMRRLRLLNPSESARGTPELDYVPPPQIELLRERVANVPGDPTHFTIFGSELELIPTPTTAVAFNFEMLYRANLTPLDPNTNTHNWLLDLAPDMYLYGSLVEAAPWLLGDERIPVWQTAIDDGYTSLNELSDKAMMGAGPLIIRRRRGGY